MVIHFKLFSRTVHSGSSHPLLPEQPQRNIHFNMKLLAGFGMAKM